MTARETVTRKGARYVLEGRLQVVSMGGGRVRARCQGSEAEPYTVVIDHDGLRYCSCQARVRCAHLAALELVVADPWPEPVLE